VAIAPAVIPIWVQVPKLAKKVAAPAIVKYLPKVFSLLCLAKYHIGAPTKVETAEAIRIANLGLLIIKSLIA